MSGVLGFPAPADARVAAELRGLARQHGLTDRQEHQVVGRFLRTVEREHRSTAVGVMEARRVLRSFEPGLAEQGGAA